MIRKPSYWQRRGRLIAIQFVIATLLLTICTPLGLWIAQLNSQVRRPEARTQGEGPLDSQVRRPGAGTQGQLDLQVRGPEAPT